MISILSFLTGLWGPLSTILTNITDLQKTKLLAQTDVEKAQIQAQIIELQSRAQVLVSQAGDRLNGFMRFLIALGPAAYFAKIFLYDKVIGSFLGCVGKTDGIEHCKTFNTDQLNDPNLWWVALAVVGFYFMTSKKWK